MQLPWCAMTTRLLSFLLMIEDALSVRRGSSVTSTRMVNYHKGLARMVIDGGGVIHLQNFSLADGQICLKAALYWPNCETPVAHAIYPQENFDWRRRSAAGSGKTCCGRLSRALAACRTSSSTLLNKMAPPFWK
jgi:hypothetical protein